MNRLTLLACASLLLVTSIGCAAIPRRKEPIVLGYLGGISGKSSGLGLAGRDGAVLAVEEINAAGGIDGREVVLEIVDDGSGPGAGEAGVRELARKGAVAIIGPMTSASAVEAVPAANELGIPLISPTVTSTDFTGEDDCFMRTCSDNESYGEKLAGDALERLGVRRAGCIVDDANASYSRTVAKHFEDAFVEGGGQSVGTEGYKTGGATDFTTVADELIARRPDAIFVAGNPLDSGLIVQRLRNGGFTGQVLLAQWSVSSAADLLKSGGKSVDGAYFRDNYDRTSDAPEFVDWVARFEERFAYNPGFASVHTYDATRFAATVAARRARGAAMKAALIEAGSWQGLQDRFSFDRFGDTVRPSYPIMIENGEFVSAGES